MTSRKGVPRVVWERRRVDPETGDEKVDSVPFLSVSRSLGDFWSYCPRTEKYVVSPFPDVRIQALNALFMKFVVLASDGLWNVMTPQEVVDFIWDYTDGLNEEKVNRPRLAIRALINEALNRWKKKQLVADNISVVLAFFTPDEPPKWPCYKRYVSYMAEVNAARGKTATPGTSAAPPTSTSGIDADGESSASTESSTNTASPGTSAAPSTSTSGSNVGGESSANTESSTNTATPGTGAAPPILSSGSNVGGESSANTESSTNATSPAASADPPTPTSGSTINEGGSANTVSPAVSATPSAPSSASSGESSVSTVSPTASEASPTPTSGSTADGESSEVRKNPTPPPTALLAPPTSPSKSPSSTSRSSSAPPPSLPSQSQEQQDHCLSTKSGIASHFKETVPGGVTVEFHTEIKHRHRKKPKRLSSHSKVKDDNGSYSDGDASGVTSTSFYSLDPTGSLKRSPLKRERSGEDATSSSEPLPKKSKLDLPDSGCYCGSDKMESEDSSPPADIAEAALMDLDQTSSYELSIGVETDDSEGRNKPAENPKR